jgi:predicted amidohydrolase
MSQTPNLMSQTPYLAAAVQMQSGEDKGRNLATAIRLVEQAAAAGARLVALPELFNCFGRYDVVAAQAETVPGPTSDAMAELAARLRITLLAGSIAERADTAEPNLDAAIYNASLLFDPDGRLLAHYRKVHLFDVDLPGQVVVRESRWFGAGHSIAAVATPLGRLGIAICYDLRFPELFRRLSAAGAQVIILPSAFTLPTGRDHWEVLLRARAIENQTYVVAPNQSGRHSPQFTSYGHSAIVDPWGRMLASAPETGETIVTSTIDLEQLAAIRKQLPALEHRREI